MRRYGQCEKGISDPASAAATGSYLSETFNSLLAEGTSTSHTAAADRCLPASSLVRTAESGTVAARYLYKDRYLMMIKFTDSNVSHVSADPGGRSLDGIAGLNPAWGGWGGGTDVYLL